MDEELIQEYLKRFDKAFSLLKNEDKCSVWYMELTEEYLSDHQQELADRMLQNHNTDSSVFISGALIFYGYRMGAVKLKGKNECCTRQGGYMDNAIWCYNLDEILNEETEEDNPDDGASNIIEWIINPGGNIDVADAVIEKMIVPMVKNLCRMAPPGKRAECTILMPPISKDIELQDWSSIFKKIKATELQINLVDYGQLLNIENNERNYIIQYQTDGFRQYLIVTAYEIIRGHSTCLGSMAFDVENYDRQYELQSIKPMSFLIDNHDNRYDNKPNEKIDFNWEYKECKYPVSTGFNSFLGSHNASFGRELYKPSGNPTKSQDAEAIRNVFKANEALQPLEIVSRLIKEPNLYNIALGDLVYVANILERDKGFKTVSIETNKSYTLGTYKHFAPFIDISRLDKIPSNYASITWKLRDKRTTIVPYYKLDINKNTDVQIIESIVDHFEHCTAEIVADDLLFLYKNGEDATSFFVAKVFLYLSQLNSIEIESKNEFVSDIDNVDEVNYQEIKKPEIKPINKKSSAILKKSIFKNSNVRSSVLDMPLEKMGFTVRTYNCLKRAGIKTAGDISKKTSGDLLKVRNLGKTNRTEIINKLEKMGLKLADA